MEQIADVIAALCVLGIWAMLVWSLVCLVRRK